MFLLAALLCNYGRGKCLIDIGTEGIRFGLPSPNWLIELGTWLMGTESELVLKSRRVVPGRLLATGFRFLFPDWPSAARDLVARSHQVSPRT